MSSKSDIIGSNKKIELDVVIEDEEAKSIAEEILIKHIKTFNELAKNSEDK